VRVKILLYDRLLYKRSESLSITLFIIIREMRIRHISIKRFGFEGVGFGLGLGG
jgi:hypothetical protein